MIARAQAKCRPEWCARYTVGDVRALRRNNDAVVVSKLLMHVGDWQAACREFVRVLRPGACIVQLDDAAPFGHPVRKYFARRADALGFMNRFIGLDPRDFTRLVQFFAAQRCERLPVDISDLKWQREISYGDALGQLEDRLLAEFWYIPLSAYAGLLEDTARWVGEQPGGRSRTAILAPCLAAEVFRKNAHSWNRRATCGGRVGSGSGAAVSAQPTDRPAFHRQRPYCFTAANWRLGPIPEVASLFDHLVDAGR
jgi:SAM-dependent methyltransferase